MKWGALIGAAAMGFFVAGCGGSGGTTTFNPTPTPTPTLPSPVTFNFSGLTKFASSRANSVHTTEPASARVYVGPESSNLETVVAGFPYVDTDSRGMFTGLTTTTADARVALLVDHNKDGELDQVFYPDLGVNTGVASSPLRAYGASYAALTGPVDMNLGDIVVNCNTRSKYFKPTVKLDKQNYAQGEQQVATVRVVNNTGSAYNVFLQARREKNPKIVIETGAVVNVGAYSTQDYSWTRTIFEDLTNSPTGSDYKMELLASTDFVGEMFMRQNGNIIFNFSQLSGVDDVFLTRPNRQRISYTPHVLNSDLQVEGQYLAGTTVGLELGTVNGTFHVPGPNAVVNSLSASEYEVLIDIDPAPGFEVQARIKFEYGGGSLPGFDVVASDNYNVLGTLPGDTIKPSLSVVSLDHLLADYEYVHDIGAGRGTNAEQYDNVDGSCFRTEPYTIQFTASDETALQDVTVNWGEGAPEVYTDLSRIVEHSYLTDGYKDIVITARDLAGNITEIKHKAEICLPVDEAEADIYTSMLSWNGGATFVPGAVITNYYSSTGNFVEGNNAVGRIKAACEIYYYGGVGVRYGAAEDGTLWIGSDFSDDGHGVNKGEQRGGTRVANLHGGGEAVFSVIPGPRTDLLDTSYALGSTNLKKFKSIDWWLDFGNNAGWY